MRREPVMPGDIPRRARIDRRLAAWLAGVVLAGGWLAGGCAGTGLSPVRLVTWVQLGADGAAIARAVTAGPACPDITIDAVSAPMQLRAGPSAAFPVTVCEKTVPGGTASASIDGRPLPLPGGAVSRIAGVGDTGCRLKVGHPFQACNDPAAWPFARIAASAAAWRPDLVISTGDYLYRELACPAGNAGCAGSPWGDNWAAWDADFFTPAAPLLEAAPWVFARGDHELCSRGGEGFVRFLDWRPAAACRDASDPWRVPLDDVTLVVMDSVDADDETADPARVATYRNEFEEVRRLATDPTWLMMHKPLWAVRPKAGAGGGVGLVNLNPTLQQASGNTLPPGIRRLIVGHVHVFEALDFADGRPPAFVIGTGGTSLDPQPEGSPAGHAIAGTTIAGGSVVSAFGFVAFERAGAEWTTTLRGPDGAAIVVCGTAPASCARPR